MIIKKIKNIPIPADHILLSLDVITMFTNVTKELTIDSLDRRAHILGQKCDIPFSEIINTVNTIFE